MARKIKKTDREKAWNRKRTSTKPYGIEWRKKRKAFLIFCEGLNTEPAYFKSFPLGNATVEAIGRGMSKTSLVEWVIRRAQYDPDISRKEVWIVFDRDGIPEEREMLETDFDKAIKLAVREGYRVAYSNDVFELWFVLHYQELSAPWNRQHYYQALSQLWYCNYELEGKRKEFCRKIYQLLKADENASQESALFRARVLWQSQHHLPYSAQNPCTTVFQLVEELNKYL
ncbi:MAG: RloB domain-containing protein [Saprospirales bacterium]|nr:RloB domain-containing protein [Saprospirales bacterium]